MPFQMDKQHIAMLLLTVEIHILFEMNRDFIIKSDVSHRNPPTLQN